MHGDMIGGLERRCELASSVGSRCSRSSAAPIRLMRYAALPPAARKRNMRLERMRVFSALLPRLYRGVSVLWNALGMLRSFSCISGAYWKMRGHCRSPMGTSHAPDVHPQTRCWRIAEETRQNTSSMHSYADLCSRLSRLLLQRAAGKIIQYAFTIGGNPSIGLVFPWYNAQKAIVRQRLCSCAASGRN